MRAKANEKRIRAKQKIPLKCQIGSLRTVRISNFDVDAYYRQSLIRTLSNISVYKGGKPRIDREKVYRLRDEGLSTYKIADQMGISRMSVHRILNG